MTSTAPAASVACGIDIGGSGVKSALVDLATGTFIGERVRIDTPEESTPAAVAEVCRELLKQLEVGDDVPVGVALPAPIVHGTVPFIANLDKSWTGVNLTELMPEYLGRPVTGLNDADAAGLAEVAFGAAKDVPGTIIVTTLGTGIGSAVIVDGTLVPNTELGHLEIDGYDAESRASAGQRTAQELSWKKWAKRLQRYYAHVEMLFSPDLFVVAGESPASTRSTCRCSTSRPRSSRLSCSTRPESWGPPTRPPARAPPDEAASGAGAGRRRAEVHLIRDCPSGQGALCCRRGWSARGLMTLEAWVKQRSSVLSVPMQSLLKAPKQ